MLSFLRSLLRGLLTASLALLLLFEEWGWEPLARLLARLAKLPLWSRMERRIQALPRWGALLVFAVPVVTLLPIKLLALYFFGTGQKMLGLVVLLTAKVLGTAVAARLFQLTHPALMQFAWFAHWYPRWKTWKDALLKRIRASAVWQAGRRIKAQVRAWWKSV